MILPLSIHMLSPSLQSVPVTQTARVEKSKRTSTAVTSHFILYNGVQGSIYVLLEKYEVIILFAALQQLHGHGCRERLFQRGYQSA